MAKWADYLICAAQNDNKGRIKTVSAHLDTYGGSAKAAASQARAAVVSAIERGTTYMTVTVAGSKLAKGAAVGVVEIDGEKFLRTDRNKTKRDNLGNLPETCSGVTTKS